MILMTSCSDVLSSLLIDSRSAFGLRLLRFA